MAELFEFKCPNCGGAIEFDSTAQRMKCPYCDSEFDMNAMREHEQEVQCAHTDQVNWSAAAGTQWEEGEQENVAVYVCNSCGGEIVGDQNTSASSCPFCGNPVVMAGKVSGVLRPDYVIPFKLDKKAAKEGLLRHLKGKKLLPKVFKDENHIDEIRGVYVPFWLFDTDVDVSARYGATRIHTWSDAHYRYTRTDHFAIYRGGKARFEKVPVDGSSKILNELMESIEPYDFSQAVDFQTAYLAGYLADKYDVGWEESQNRANSRIRQTSDALLYSTVSGYASVTPEGGNILYQNSQAKYALYPVWILNTTWNGQRYTFAMNGQTGKFVGDLPVDKGAYWRWWGLYTGIIGAAAFAFIALTGLL